MKRIARYLGAVAVTAAAMALSTCGKIPEYLGKVCKVYGCVTEEGTGAPLESVEVSVGSSLYSELTNGLGDYEMEMMEGRWTLSFLKEGYEPESITVTITLAEPRVRQDAVLKPIVPDLVGVWVANDVPTSFGGGGLVDAELTLRADEEKTFEALMYDDIQSPDRVLQDWSTKGTYSLVPGAIVGLVTQWYVGGEWQVVDPPMESTTYFSLSEDGQQLTVPMDLDWDGSPETEWVYLRQ